MELDLAMAAPWSSGDDLAVSSVWSGFEGYLRHIFFVLLCVLLCVLSVCVLSVCVLCVCVLCVVLCYVLGCLNH